MANRCHLRNIYHDEHFLNIKASKFSYFVSQNTCAYKENESKYFNVKIGVVGQSECLILTMNTQDQWCYVITYVLD